MRRYQPGDAVWRYCEAQWVRPISAQHELLEKIEHPDFVIGPPVFDGERLYVNCVDGTITCYDATPYAS